MNLYEQDLQNIISNKDIDWAQLKNKSVFITGSTGLIGKTITKVLMKLNELYNYNIQLILLVRNKDRAVVLFGEHKNITYIVGSNEVFTCDLKVDYIIHAASPTKSNFFIEHPIETLDSAVIGIKNILELASKNDVKSMVYLSSMEVYGTMNDDNVDESKLGYVDLFSARSCYPEGKRVSEMYCYLYSKQKDINVKVARLSMTFGAGISKEENRVYKQFADAVINKRNIVLKSTGSTIINFVYLSDAVEALFFILFKGEKGNAYNIASDNTYHMTIKDSAQWLISEYSPENKVVIEEAVLTSGLAPNNDMILNNTSIKGLGWNPKYDIKDGYRRLIDYLIDSQTNE